MSITDTLRDGATYAGHLFHIVLNYVVLLLTLVPHLFLFRNGSRKWLFLFALLTAIQVSLWFTSGAVGISLVWCGMAGYNLLLLLQNRKEKCGYCSSPAFVAISSCWHYGVLLFVFSRNHDHRARDSLFFGMALGFGLERYRKKKSFVQEHRKS